MIERLRTKAGAQARRGANGAVVGTAQRRSKNLKSSLTEAKDTAQRMLDLACAALQFDDGDLADAVAELDEVLETLLHDTRAKCVIAARSPRDAEQMAPVLQVVSAIERIGDAAMDIGRIVTRRLGVPEEMAAALGDAEEFSHQAHIGVDSEFARYDLSADRLGLEAGMRVVAVRRSGAQVATTVALLPGDVVVLRGPGARVSSPNALGGAAQPDSFVAERPSSESDTPVRVVVTMLSTGMVVLRLAYSALVLRDRALAAEVDHLAAGLDQQGDDLESSLLRAAAHSADSSRVQGLLHLEQAVRDIASAAQEMAMPVAAGKELHAVVGLALGDASEIVARVAVAAGSSADGVTLDELRERTGTGFAALAVRRDGRYLYRPQPEMVVRAADQVLGWGPREGCAQLAQHCGSTAACT